MKPLKLTLSAFGPYADETVIVFYTAWRTGYFFWSTGEYGGRKNDNL